MTRWLKDKRDGYVLPWSRDLARNRRSGAPMQATPVRLVPRMEPVAPLPEPVVEPVVEPVAPPPEPVVEPVADPHIDPFAEPHNQ
jgi:colicin import membrane protein